MIWCLGSFFLMCFHAFESASFQQKQKFQDCRTQSDVCQKTFTIQCKFANDPSSFNCGVDSELKVTAGELTGDWCVRLPSIPLLFTVAAGR